MSWLKDVEDKRTQEIEREKRQWEEAKRLDAMVRRLLEDVGMAKWGQHFSWDLLFKYGTLPGYVKHYKVESYLKMTAGQRSQWTVTHETHMTITRYNVGLILGNPNGGTPNHFYVTDGESYGRNATTADTSESELKDALKKVVVG